MHVYPPFPFTPAVSSHWSSVFTWHKHIVLALSILFRCFHCFCNAKKHPRLPKQTMKTQKHSQRAMCFLQVNNHQLFEFLRTVLDKQSYSKAVFLNGCSHKQKTKQTPFWITSVPCFALPVTAVSDPWAHWLLLSKYTMCWIVGYCYKCNSITIAQCRSLVLKVGSGSLREFQGVPS